MGNVRRQALIEPDVADPHGAPIDVERATAESDPGKPRRLHSPALFGGDREVVIIHQGQEYRLRITRADKLILTK